jgi:predicted metal-dependent peptidase
MNVNKTRLLRAIKQANIELVYSEDVPTSATAYNKETHQLAICLGRAYIEGTDEEQVYLLAHELGHIYRGDLLVSTLQPDIWNVAADACIEHHLRKTLGPMPSMTLSTGQVIEGVTIEKLRTRFEKLKDVEPTRAKPIYDIILEQCEEEMKQYEGGCGMKGLDPEDAEARRAVKRASADLTMSKDYQEVGGAGRDEPKQLDRRIIVSSPEYGLAERLREALRAIKTFALGKTSVRTRSWARPGRVEGIPSVARLPRAKVTVCVDISGSMTPMVERLCALVEGAAREFDVTWVAWADRAAVVHNPRQIVNADVGGGTQLIPCLHLVARSGHPDLCVIVTDAQLGDSPAEPNFPVLWAIVGDGNECSQSWGKKVRL